MSERVFLAINSGSSNIKFGVFTAAGQPAALHRGTIDGPDRSSAVARLLSEVDGRYTLAGAAHRIVHGGPTLTQSQIVTADVIEGLQAVVSFAPNHLPDAIALIQGFRATRADLPQIVCFDTAFHADLPPVARRLPIPAAYEAQGVRRYGFHGLSYQFLLQELQGLAGSDGAGGKVVLAHLGHGSSLAAVHAGACLDTSMGFTPIGGVVMGTRSGDIDPGVAAYIACASSLDAAQVERVLSHASGLLGISGRSADMRELLDRESTEPNCRLAVDIYCYEIKKRIGAYAAVLGGLDTLVFSGGIGEHAPIVRARICAGLEFLGLDIDHDRNTNNAPLISTASSPVAVRVIATDEEAVLAQAAYRLLH
jgi:acetate kinase